VMRCIALSQAWQDAGGECVLLAAETTPSVENWLLREDVKLKHISVETGSRRDAEATIQIARESKPAWIVVDGYHFGAEYQSTIKQSGYPLLFIDDNGHADRYHADLVLNQNVHANEGLYAQRDSCTRLLLGPRFAMLRREFRSSWNSARDFPERGSKVLVTMGGSDPGNFTECAIQALNLVREENLEAIVVVGGCNPNASSLEHFAAREKKQIGLRRDVQNMPEVMAWADIAISAAGTTCWEMCRMGLPALLTDLAANQTAGAHELARRGCAIYLGPPQQVSPEKLAEQVERLLASPAERQAMSLRSRELVDGEGARRVVSLLRGVSLHLRPAQERDCRMLWEWVNDAQVRKASFSTASISWETHSAWFADKLRRKDCSILIAENDDGTPIGQVRFDTGANGDAVVDVSIASAWRGRGLAVPLIRQAAQSLISTSRRGRLHAFVKRENAASLKAFEHGGFKRVGVDQVQGKEAVHLIYEAG
jgi:UDP-2,4-diacetamido-2,4,6-trideoxy-beta-L-altropyranose hydrolase